MRNSVYRLQRLSTQRMHFIVLFSMKVALGLSLLERQTTTSVSIQAASPNCHTVHKRSSSDDNHTLPSALPMANYTEFQDMICQLLWSSINRQQLNKAEHNMTTCTLWEQLDKAQRNDNSSDSCNSVCK